MAKETWRSGKLNIGPDGKLPDHVSDVLKQWLIDQPAKGTVPDTPPWIAFPIYPRYTIGWRMGPGEDYMHAFISWLRDLTEEQFKDFSNRFPEPKCWEGFLVSVYASRDAGKP